MDADDVELFSRSIRGAVGSASGAALDSALAELGWSDALAEDPRAAISTLFELQGRSTATSSALDRVVGGPLVDISVDDSAVVLPPFGRWAPPGSVVDGGLQVHGLATAVALHTTVLLVATTDDGLACFVVPTSSLHLRPVEGVDPDLGLVEVTGTDLVLPPLASLATGAWDDAVRLGRIAVAHELIGVSRTMLGLAREHALERIQFGQPISAFQAVRHRLAETLVAIETAEASVDAAWLDPSPAAASMAKALAGRGARTTSRHCQQVCAGIGFTTEHPLHRSIRRALTLDGLFGTAVALTRATGDDLISSRTLPPLLPL